jgi:hypothetical protein
VSSVRTLRSCESLVLTIHAVKTLAIRDTAEEKLVKRREALQGQNPQATKWTEDNEMRDAIKVRAATVLSTSWAEHPV